MNQFSVLENEELKEELDDFGTIETIRISHKVCDKKRKKSKGNKSWKEKNEGLEKKESSEGIFPEILRCKNCFKCHFPSKKA